MRIVSRIAGGVRGLAQRERADAELDEELHAVFHRICRGKNSPEASAATKAERQARAEMGSPRRPEGMGA